MAKKKKLRFPMKCPACRPTVGVLCAQEFALHVYFVHCCNWREDCPCGHGNTGLRVDGDRLVAHLESFDDPLGHLVQYDTLNKIAKVGQG